MDDECQQTVPARVTGRAALVAELALALRVDSTADVSRVDPA
jgi:hypothetical protein